MSFHYIRGVGSPKLKQKVLFVAGLHKSSFGAGCSTENTAKQGGLGFRDQTQPKTEVPLRGAAHTSESENRKSSQIARTEATASLPKGITERN